MVEGYFTTGWVGQGREEHQTNDESMSSDTETKKKERLGEKQQ